MKEVFFDQLPFYECEDGKVLICSHQSKHMKKLVPESSEESNEEESSESIL